MCREHHLPSYQRKLVRTVLEQFVLPLRGGDDVRVAVADADGDDPGDAIEVAFAGFIPDVLLFAFDQHDGFLVIEKEAGAEIFLALGEDFGGGGAGVGLGLVR